jgi:hypothetical protein
MIVMNSSRRKKMYRGVARGGLTLIALLVIEGGIRLALINMTTTAQSSYFSERWMKSVAGEINRFGFREREYQSGPLLNASRICMIGDSFLFGQGLPAASRFSNMLEERLREEGGAFEVLNLGSKGANLPEHIEVLQRAVLPLAPDLVILQWFINDADSPSYPYPPSPRLLPWRAADRVLTRHSALWSMSRIAIDRVGLYTGVRESYWSFTRSLLIDANSAPSTEARANLQSFVERGQQNGAKVAIVLFPDLGVDLGEDYPLGFLMDRTKAQCDELGVPCLDLRAAYQNLRRDQWRKLHVNWLDSHPSELANRIATQATCEWLSQMAHDAPLL